MKKVYYIEIRYTNDNGCLCKQLFEVYQNEMDARKRLNELNEDKLEDVSYYLYVTNLL